MSGMLALKWHPIVSSADLESYLVELKNGMNESCVIRYMVVSSEMWFMI